MLRIKIAVFNHLLSQAPQARAALASFAGRCIAWSVPSLAVAGMITTDGYLAPCQSKPETTIRLNHRALGAVWTGGNVVLSDVVLEGDSELGRQIGQILRGLRWDWVEDLSRLIGDVAANRVDRGLRWAMANCTDMGWRAVESGVDYLTEEIPLLVCCYEVEKFVAAVDTLRDDTERCEKRLVLLERATR